jgi:hypothetical protein
VSQVRVGDIAHSRSGDKGDTANVSVIAWNELDYEHLREQLTEEVVAAAFGERVQGRVVRYEVPGAGALNFALEQALGGGVSRSLNLDIHGKALSTVVLDIEIPAPTRPRRGEPGYAGRGAVE